MITTEQIKELRDLTGISVMQCKKALEEAGGDKEKALEILREKSSDIAAKKGDRELGAGAIQAYIHSNKNVGALVELSCETDFVARNEEFVAMARDIAMHITAATPEFLDESEVTDAKRAEIKASLGEGATEEQVAVYIAEKSLLLQPFVKNPELTIKGLVDGGVQKFGEKIAVSRFVRFSVVK
jgi:elongation factor Ts